MKIQKDVNTPKKIRENSKRYEYLAEGGNKLKTINCKNVGKHCHFSYLLSF